jgi:phosphoribosylformylglycinamidine (FGAM) synthase PurS component
MTAAAVRTWLKVMDPTSLTARETLQRTLGYGDRIEDIQRSTVWSFRWEETVDAPALLARLVADTNLIRNPNKHHVEIVTGDRALTPRGNVWVLVHSGREGSELEDALSRHRLVPGTVPAVRRGTLWELQLAAGEDRTATAEEIAVTRAHKRGLLANPHVDTVHVLAEPPGAGDLARLLAEEATEDTRIGLG